MGHGAPSWKDVVESADARIRGVDQAKIMTALAALGPIGSPASAGIFDELVDRDPFKRLLELAPCLYSQIPTKVSARGVVHLCEVTLGVPITSSNVYDAFQVQHPHISGLTYLNPPVTEGAGGGDIMEAFCAEVLANHGVPAMATDTAGWPKWSSPAHLSLNSGKMSPLKLYGDLLIPAAPHNILISVKSEAARERFVVSGNRLESVGFGFFNEANEFWTTNRMNLLKRWGFIAVYMPRSTLDQLNQHLKDEGTEQYAININGRRLYRSLEEFGDDMFRVAGKLTTDL